VSRVLLVTIILTGRSGTEVVCCETARGLRRRNHEVVIYTQQEGPTAHQLRAEGFQITTDLASLSFVPDVIQSNQTYPLLEAIGRFPGTPAISICHDATVWYDEPIDLPSMRHVAVDLACRDRIVSRFAHLAGRVEILHNAVDLEAFRPRAPLPPRPKRALILAKHPSYLDAVRAACLQRGLDLDILGPAVGNEVDDLPSCLRDYDLVFASARSAIEAMAVGCAVIVVDSRGVAGLVTHDAVSSWRENNFGRRLFSRPASTEVIVAEIDRYAAADAQLVSRFIRENSSLDGYLDRLEVIHREVIAESAAQPVDRDDLLYRMSRSFRPIQAASHAQMEFDFQSARAREVERAAIFEQQARTLEDEIKRHARAWEAELERRTQIWEAESQRQAGTLQDEIHRHARAWEAELERCAQIWQAESQRQASVRDAEFQRQASIREVEFQRQTSIREVEFQRQTSTKEAEFRHQLGIKEAEFQQQLSIKDAEFAAFRAWVAPANLPRRILHKIRRKLFGG
jgi:hypothetical protein